MGYCTQTDLAGCVATSTRAGRCCPLPQGDKFPPPPARTGWLGVDCQAEDLCYFGPDNLGLRVPAGVVGIDVDHYDSKKGGVTLARLEADLGELPESAVLTSRTDGISGIRFLQVPEGTVLAGVLGDSIEVIQRHHRYAVAAPSAPENQAALPLAARRLRS